MLVVGARGFAKELLEIFHITNQTDNLVFYDDINPSLESLLFDSFPILNHIDQASKYFKEVDSRYCLGVGNPLLRRELSDKMAKVGGILSSVLSPQAIVGSYNVKVGQGTNILPGAIISNDVSIGVGCIVYYNAVITHDCIIGDFVEISPSANLLGRCDIGSFSHIAAGSTILPNIKIGKNVLVAAGAVVSADVPDNCMVAGLPAVIKKIRNPLLF